MAKWKQTFSERFWSKVVKRGADECWLWTGAAYTDKSGNKRGQIWDGVRVISAPKAALMFSGRWVDGRMALHRCSSTLCVNERHLYAGTPSNNVRDSIAAGTHVGNPAPRGAKNYNAKLRASDIPKIRSARYAGMSYQKIADMSSVSKSGIAKIMDGVTWSHV